MSRKPRLSLQQRLGRNLKTMRKRKGFSQVEMGRFLRIDQSAVHRVETGKRKLTAVELYRAAQFFGVPMAAFFRECM